MKNPEVFPRVSREEEDVIGKSEEEVGFDEAVEEFGEKNEEKDYEIRMADYNEFRYGDDMESYKYFEEIIQAFDEMVAKECPTEYAQLNEK